MDEGRERKKKTCKADRQRLVRLDHSAVLSLRALLISPAFVPHRRKKIRLL